IGFPKPTKEYMDYVLDDLKIDKKEILIIGDSVTSDMMLGINNGIDTCWFNEENKKTDANITYEVHNYDDILRLLMDES
ncbi:MAG: HAD hydrolase-like protein, partial [Bacilli bacterium]|nr:HAD hydrolase-like protein [Bacilli bacterium]